MTGVASDPSRLADAWRRSGLTALSGHADGPALRAPGTIPLIADALAERVVLSAALGDIAIELDGASVLGQRAVQRGFTRRGRVSPGGSCRLLPAKDGWVAVSAGRPDDAWLLAAAVGVHLDEPEVPWEALSAWLEDHDFEEIAASFQMVGVAGAPVRHEPPVAAPESAARPGLPDTVAALPPRSVAGLRVIDFSAMWAGPLAAHLLATAGAEVTTVESVRRPDGARQGDPELHRALHAGHDLVSIDPENPADLRRVQELVGSADIVIEASRPRALRAWGLNAQEFAESGGAWVSITAAGRGSERVGFGDDVAAAAGLVAVDAAGSPVFCADAIADPITGLTAAALCASDFGGGVVWDCSMTHIVHSCVGVDAFRGHRGVPSEPAC